MKITESSQHALFLTTFTIWETNDSPFLMLEGGCSSFSRGISAADNPKKESTKDTAGKVHTPGFGGANRERTATGRSSSGTRCVGSAPRKIPVEGTFERKFFQETPAPSSRSRMVPVMGRYPPEGGEGGGMISAVVRWPKEVAASVYARFGNVGPITEEKYRSLIANVWASP